MAKSKGTDTDLPATTRQTRAEYAGSRVDGFIIVGIVIAGRTVGGFADGVVGIGNLVHRDKRRPLLRRHGSLIPARTK